MNIHIDRKVGYDKAVKMFMKLHPRKVQTKNLVFDI